MNTNSQLEARLHRAAEQILGDSSLTDEMDDSPANRLLEWGAATSRRLAERTATLSDPDADAVMEDHLPVLRRVIRNINKLIGALGAGAGADEIAEILQKALTAAAELPSLTVQPPPDVHAAAEMIHKMPPDDALGKIMSYFSERTSS